MANHNPEYITSSTVKRLLGGRGDKLIKGGRTFARQLARERFGVVDEESSFKGNYATEHGNQYEPEALARYQQETFTEVHSMQKVVTKGWLSCTPDGLIGDDIITEVKCPFDTDNHMSNLLEQAFVKDYEAQCRFQMMLTERPLCHLISYDPRWPEPYDITWVELERDKEWEAFCMNRIDQAEAIISKTLKQLEELA